MWFRFCKAMSSRIPFEMNVYIILQYTGSCLYVSTLWHHVKLSVQQKCLLLSSSSKMSVSRVFHQGVSSTFDFLFKKRKAFNIGLNKYSFRCLWRSHARNPSVVSETEYRPVWWFHICLWQLFLDMMSAVSLKLFLN